MTAQKKLLGSMALGKYYILFIVYGTYDLNIRFHDGLRDARENPVVQSVRIKLVGQRREPGNVREHAFKVQNTSTLKTQHS